MPKKGTFMTNHERDLLKKAARKRKAGRKEEKRAAQAAREAEAVADIKAAKQFSKEAQATIEHFRDQARRAVEANKRLNYSVDRLNADLKEAAAMNRAQKKAYGDLIADVGSHNADAISGIDREALAEEMFEAFNEAAPSQNDAKPLSETSEGFKDYWIAAAEAGLQFTLQHLPGNVEAGRIRASLDRASARIEALAGQNHDYAKRIVDLEASREDVAGKGIRLANEVVEEYEANIAGYKARIADLEAQNEGLNSACFGHSNQAELYKARVDELETAIGEADEEIQRLREQLDAEADEE